MHSIERDKERRYEVYSEMEYELTHPEKVKPYYPKDISLFEREPVKVYRLLFIISLLLNIFLINIKTVLNSANFVKKEGVLYMLVMNKRISTFIEQSYTDFRKNCAS